MAVRKRGDGYQADFMQNGSRHRGQFTTAEAAETWEQEAKLCLRKGLPVPASATTLGAAASKQYDTLGAIFAYTAENEWRGQANEVQTVKRARDVVEFFGPTTLMRTIGYEDINRYVASRKAAKDAGGTINRKTAALSKMLTVAHRLGVIPSRPTFKRQKETAGRERFLSRNEERALVNTLRQRGKVAHADLVEFLADTGLRVGEALSLDWKDTHEARVTVIGAKAKSSKTRHVPLTERSRRILAERRNEKGGPFHAVTYDSFHFAFQSAVDHHGLEDVVIHTLRHTAASRLAQGGADAFRIMSFMGHAGLKTTQRYMKLAPNSLDAMASILEDA